MLDQIKEIISVYLLIPFVAIVGLIFSIRFQFVQCTHVTKAWHFFFGDRDPKKRSSSFSAVAAVLGGNLGTGNISGIAVALAMGGPGALFWMWVMATLGAILKFVGCILGVLYRQKGKHGEFIGGPMYYISKGLKKPTLAKLYCLLALCAAMTVGNMVQMNSLALPFTAAGVPPLATGIVMSLIIASVILGGLHRFSRIAALVVPFMAVGYIAACFIIVLFHYDKLLPAIQLIFQAAFNNQALAGGATGFAVLQAIRVGFDRGLFATDVGVGIDAIVHSSVESNQSLTQTALTQGLISTLSPFIVMLVCTLTGLVLMVTDVWQLAEFQSTTMCIEAFKRGLHTEYAGHFITTTLFFFAFTTILTWSFCFDKAIEYLFSAKYVRLFQIFFVACVPLGALFHVRAVWTLADIFMNLMLVINVIALIGLYKEVAMLFHTPERKQVFLRKAEKDSPPPGFA